MPTVDETQIQLDPTDPRQRFAVEVVRRLQEAGFTALWAGGCVRDLLLGWRPADYDVATDARPGQVRRLFRDRTAVMVGASFGVVIIVGPAEAGQIDVATFRTEGEYSDGRHPDHVRFSTPEQDAKRRDFTINGMFYDPIARRLLDFVGGRKDLERRIVRAIGDPMQRFAEDKLRMLRAVRFAAILDFELDSRTAEAVKQLHAGIRQVSAERIAEELRKLLVCTHRRRGVELCEQLGLLGDILPEVSRLADIERKHFQKLGQSTGGTTVTNSEPASTSGHGGARRNGPQGSPGTQAEERSAAESAIAQNGPASLDSNSVGSSVHPSCTDSGAEAGCEGGGN